ncbi:unnamed protein product [Caenorhabditis sp. 36 PRJEB53466]|nr:unnamed protein product [Caenorhabditis sp. 36 PRJEB53466]
MSSKFLLLFALLLTMSRAQTVASERAPKVLCDLCHNGLSVVQSQLVVLESLTKNNLGAVVNTACSAAPTNIPIVKALCTVLKDDLVEALLTLVQGIKEQTEPKLLCGYLGVCERIRSV